MGLGTFVQIKQKNSNCFFQNTFTLLGSGTENARLVPALGVPCSVAVHFLIVPPGSSNKETSCPEQLCNLCSLRMSTHGKEKALVTCCSTAPSPAVKGRSNQVTSRGSFQPAPLWFSMQLLGYSPKKKKKKNHMQNFTLHLWLTTINRFPPFGNNLVFNPNFTSGWSPYL